MSTKHGAVEQTEYPYRDESWLREQYVDRVKSVHEIAASVDMKSDTIRRWLKRHGIETSGYSRARLPDGVFEKLSDKEWLRERYVDEHMSQKELAQELDVHSKTIRRWLDRHGIERRSMASACLPAGVHEKLSDGEWLRERYVEEEKSTTVISELLDVTQPTVLNWLDRHDIDTRGRGAD